MTTNLAVLGSPISHSLSPVLHRAAYRYLNLPWVYDAIETTVDELEVALAGNNLCAASITMPLKEKAFEITSSRDSAATVTESVNTLISTDSGWAGFNTDVFGISRSIENCLTSHPLVVGTGATARSAIYALSQKPDIHTIGIWGRNPAKVAKCVSFATELNMVASIAVDLGEGLQDSDLVISTVPGTSSREVWQEVASNQIPDQAVLFDIAYSPWPSIAAQTFGNREVISGLEMLIWQATDQVRLFCEHIEPGIHVDNQALYDVMRDAVRPS